MTKFEVPRFGLLCWLTISLTHSLSEPRRAIAQQSKDQETEQVLLIVGAAGSAEFGEQFERWASDWEEIARQAGAELKSVGRESAGDQSDRELCEAFFRDVAAQSSAPLWVVMIGHGTFTRGVAKFNFRGPDASAEEFSAWMKPLRRPLIVINAASSSGPFINRLSGSGRVVVTATKSGTEQNFARFGDYFVQSLNTPDSDLDHDDEVSVLEAFLSASARVRDFYEAEARIATEHALIDDNGDGKGTPPTMFRAARPVGEAKDGSDLDGRLASRITLQAANKRLKLTISESAQRDSIEQQLEQLRRRRSDFPEETYDRQIEPLLIRLALLYQNAEKRTVQAESQP